MNRFLLSPFLSATFWPPNGKWFNYHIAFSPQGEFEPCQFCIPFIFINILNARTYLSPRRGRKIVAHGASRGKVGRPPPTAPQGAKEITSTAVDFLDIAGNYGRGLQAESLTHLAICVGRV
jgi:hypothetical protein